MSLVSDVFDAPLDAGVRNRPGEIVVLLCRAMEASISSLQGEASLRST
jgi:hypothetical protein